MARSAAIILFIAVFNIHDTEAQQEDHGDVNMQQAHTMVNEADVQWMTGPPSLPVGCKIKALLGHPMKEGPFVIRASFPAGYLIPPHWHPTVENITVLKGNLFMGTAEKIDETKAMQLKPGWFASMPAKTPHYIFTREEVIVQIHGNGPFSINYINASDDPRKPDK